VCIYIYIYIYTSLSKTRREKMKYVCARGRTVMEIDFSLVMPTDGRTEILGDIIAADSFYRTVNNTVTVLL